MKYSILYPFIILVTGSILFSGCRNQTERPADPYQHITDPQIQEVISKAIDRAGGLDSWQQKISLSFQKDFALYDSTGAVERAVLETHHYQYQPEEIITITWTVDSTEYKLTNPQGEAVRTMNGQIDQKADPISLQNTILSATYVISLPFKLLDKGVALTYEGRDTLEDGQAVEVIRGVFNPNQHSNHSTPDIWWYYFDPTDYKLAAYMVKHADHYSYVRNLRYMTIDGFLFPRERKSYRVDSQRNILYLRATYGYD